MKTFVLKIKGKLYGYYFGETKEHAAAHARIIYPWVKPQHLKAIIYR